jgi:restriction system protein
MWKFIPEIWRFTLDREAERMPSMADANYYELLDLESSATADEIKAAYLRIMKIVHPDKGGSGGLFRQIQMAYETLSDPVRRAAYDRNGYADQDERSSDPAPGWRGADNRPPNDPGPKAQSRSDSSTSREDSPDDEPPPSPPPSSDSGATVREGNPGTASSVARKHFATNPSWALFTSGILIAVLAANIGKGSSGFVFIGICVAVVGFVGVLGKRKAAHHNAMQRAGIANIDLMSGSQFEQRMRVAFELDGYTVYHVGGRGDFGADLVLDAPGARVVVQTKRWSQSVGPGAVQEVVASRAHYGATRAIVVTNSTFTKNALELARSNNVEMWDRSRLIDFLATQHLGSPKTGKALFLDEMKAGAPTAFKGALTLITGAIVVIFGVIGELSSIAGGPKSRRRRKR